MAIVEDILNDDEFFVDAVNTPKEGIEQHKKREELKRAIDKDRLGPNTSSVKRMKKVKKLERP